MNLSIYGNLATSNLMRQGVRLSDIEDELQQACAEAADSACIYYGDCLSIIDQYEGDVSGDSLGMDGLEYPASEWREAMSAYAFYIALEVIQEQAQEELAALEVAVDLVKYEVERLGGDVDLVTINGQDHGWAAHNYETADGVMVWSDEDTPYSYNPELLDGDLFAVQFDFEGVHISACWAPEAATTLLKDAI